MPTLKLTDHTTTSDRRAKMHKQPEPRDWPGDRVRSCVCKCERRCNVCLSETMSLTLGLLNDRLAIGGGLQLVIVPI